LQLKSAVKTRTEMAVETAGKRHRSLAATSYTWDVARLAYSLTFCLCLLALPGGQILKDSAFRLVESEAVKVTNL